MVASSQNKKIALEYFAAYETGDLNVVMQFIADEYVLHPGGDGKRMNAKERMKDEAVFFSAFSRLNVAVEDQIAERDRVANRVAMSGVHTGEYQSILPTRKRVNFPYIDILQFKAGKIIAEWVEFDTQSILRQLGRRKEKH